MACYCAGSKSQLIRLLYMRMYSKSRSGRKWVKGPSLCTENIWRTAFLCMLKFPLGFYDVLLLIASTSRCKPEASSVSCKGFISHDSIKCLYNPINLFLRHHYPADVPQCSFISEYICWNVPAPATHTFNQLSSPFHVWCAAIVKFDWFDWGWWMKTALLCQTSNTTFLSIKLAPVFITFLISIT